MDFLTVGQTAEMANNPERDKLGLELYRRVKDGDRDALADLIELYRAGLVLFIYGFVMDMCDAEELTVDVFVKLVRGRERFRGESSLKTYLFAIGKNLALRHLRAKKEHLPLGGTEQTAGDGDTPETELLRGDSKMRLYLLMRELKAEHREVLHLIYFEGMSYADAGAVLEMSKTQISSLAHRAKAALKSKLESEGLKLEDF